jgi:SAM-dependent methyltransferase
MNRGAGSNGLGVPDKTRIVRTWERNYQELGYRLWGFAPSRAARKLAATILDGNPRRSERVEILDWGCGYGRDSLYFLELGFDVIGVDLSRRAIVLARAAYKRRQESGIPLAGSASFHAGDIRSVFDSRVGQRVHAFFSNRVLHLLGQADFCDAVHDAMRYLEPGAHFCVAARNCDDFDMATMEWVPGKERVVARYKDAARTGHEIAFVTKERFLQAAGDRLEDAHFSTATEPERVGTSHTHLLIMLARASRRSSGDCVVRKPSQQCR